LVKEMLFNSAKSWCAGGKKFRERGAFYSYNIHKNMKNLYN
jgi:hypothetical protein